MDSKGCTSSLELVSQLQVVCREVGSCALAACLLQLQTENAELSS